MRLLAIETAYDVCGAAIIGDKGPEAIVERLAPRQHNEVLAPAVMRVLERAGRSFSDLDGIALSIGPGAYTGLRVGMSYVKGLAFATGLPVIPVPTLPSLLVGEWVGEIDWVATWSHGDQVYTYPATEPPQPDAVQASTWDKFAQLARGASVAGYLLERFLPAGAIRVVNTPPSAEKVGSFALAQQLEPAADLAALVPDYHHDFEKRLRRHAHS